ncbi:MAG TPA: class I SAM-dependent methyltransferase [Actinophytocola sp.]|uniref:class I SAM-dependent methyltransferase n=1 Tax=Actinophytocola sp. TaxID=1872138 RepID=UPI002DDCEC49|nr:class I SAM-dependent methyltransferase [Actinophytocola sp.]HEV2783432.1 class I SAM-dependent methyltransferase [Actinophytocola sp.]
MSRTRRFYDELAEDYHLIYADWEASIGRQAAALDGLIGPARRRVLDCACGIGTQAIGLAGRGHTVIGTDLSPVAAARAATEATRRGLTVPVAAADMRALPFPDATFDVAICADNALPHFLTPQDMHAGLTGIRRVLADGGLLITSTRPYDELREQRPGYSPPWKSTTPTGRSISFQLWDWHPDGERYDLEHFTLVPDGEGWRVAVRRATYWAITRRELATLVAAAGFTDVTWHEPEDCGFFQPVLTAIAKIAV